VGTALAVTLVGNNAFAKTLADVLKEKGVITREDYDSVTKPGELDNLPGKGFTFTSPDEKFKLSLGTFLQMRYTLLDLDGANNTAAKQAQDSSKFELKRIKLFFNGYAYSKDLTYKLVTNFSNLQGGSIKNGGMLEEANINYRLADWGQLRFGQDKVPFGRQWLAPSMAQQFIDTSLATNAFIPGFDTGIMLHGRVAGGLVDYYLGGYGGAGQDTFRSTTDNAFAARLAVDPLGEVAYSESDLEYSTRPLVSLGGNFYRNTVNPGEFNSATATNNNVMFENVASGWFGIGNPLSGAKGVSATEAVDFNTEGIDGVFKWRGLSLQGEYFLGSAEGRTTHNNVHARGYYLQSGYFLIPKHLEVAARYAYLDPNRGVANDQWMETTGGVTWYFVGHNLKLQADYTNIHRQGRVASTNPGTSAVGTNDRQLRFQAQMVF
jgi:phosphate-selective porin OprO/OprP